MQSMPVQVGILVFEYARGGEEEREEQAYTLRFGVSLDATVLVLKTVAVLDGCLSG